MSIRYKFRSSVNFDTVEIENRTSISVRDLRAKILGGKSSHQQQQGFDLVFSDEVSGLEYKGDDSQIPSGSSVIVKRVPGGTGPPALSPIEAVKEVGMKNSCTLNPANDPMNVFDDFGDNLCPIPDSNFNHFDQEINTRNKMGNEMEDFTGLRLGSQKLSSKNLSQATLRASNQNGKESNILLEAKVEEQRTLNKISTSNFLALQSTNLPLEMKCSLCNTFFKEAVMIPCCQHSFCEKCIRLVLLEKGRCPKCFSGQCNMEDLLPNVSLRRAIEHFLESQMLDTGLQNALQKYVPDGESGIQVKDVSCTPSVVQMELELPQSSCATGKGSNQIFTEAYYEPPPQRNVPYPDSADSSSKRREGFWMDTGGGERNFSALGGHKKGFRKCYACGSPDHLMRDCPVSNPNPMFQPGNGVFHGGMPGYAPPYWNSATLPPFRPFVNMYNNPSMMPFNASMVPVAPFGVPTYISSMYGGLPGPGPGVNMRMRNMQPACQPGIFGLQHYENRRKYSKENLGREQLIDDEDDSPECHQHYSPEKSRECKLQKDKELCLSHYGESDTRRSEKKCQQDKYIDFDVCFAEERHEKSSRSSLAGKDKRLYHAKMSNSTSTENMPRHSDRCSEGRIKRHHEESKKYHERKREHGESDSNLSHDSIQRGVKRRVEPDTRDYHKKRHSYSDSGFEPSSPVDRRRGYKERDTGHDTRHSRHSAKHLRDEHHDDRRKMAHGSNEDHRDEYHRHQRRRVY